MAQRSPLPAPFPNTLAPRVRLSQRARLSPPSQLAPAGTLGSGTGGLAAGFFAFGSTLLPLTLVEQVAAPPGSVLDVSGGFINESPGGGAGDGGAPGDSGGAPGDSGGAPGDGGPGDGGPGDGGPGDGGSAPGDAGGGVSGAF